MKLVLPKKLCLFCLWIRSARAAHMGGRTNTFLSGLGLRSVMALSKQDPWDDGAEEDAEVPTYLLQVVLQPLVCSAGH